MRRKIFGSMRGGILAAMLVGAAAPAAVALDLVIKTTANETKLGFTEGEVVTFTFTLNPAFVSNAESSFNGSMAVWGAASTDIPIFSWIGITGVSGSFNPILGIESNSSLTVNNLGAMTVDASYEGLGYEAAGQPIFMVVGSFALFDPDFYSVPSAYVDPTAYFSSYEGVYPVETSFGFALLTNFGSDDLDYIEFTATEFAVVPEPGGLMLLATGAAAALWMARRRRA